MITIWKRWLNLIPFEHFPVSNIKMPAVYCRMGRKLRYIRIFGNKPFLVTSHPQHVTTLSQSFMQRILCVYIHVPISNESYSPTDKYIVKRISNLDRQPKLVDPQPGNFERIAKCNWASFPTSAPAIDNMIRLLPSWWQQKQYVP